MAFKLVDYITEQTSKATFHEHIRAIERAVNAGCTTEYNMEHSLTHWFVAGICHGITEGRVGASTSYHIVK